MKQGQLELWHGAAGRWAAGHGAGAAGRGSGQGAAGHGAAKGSCPLANVRKAAVFILLLFGRSTRA